MKINNAVWIGGIIGGLWGLLSFFLGVWTLREATLNKIIVFLPLYVSSIIFKDNPFLIILSSIVGLLIGIFVAFIVTKIKEKI